jgi:hypothetical protein
MNLAPRIESAGIENFERYLAQLPEVTTEAARIAINEVATGEGMKLLREGVYEEIEFPKGYVEPRIVVTRKAYNKSLEAVLSARQRPTSLARFAQNQTPESTRRTGVRVQLRPGSTVTLPKAWLQRLKSGKAQIDEGSANIGLAIRLKKGEKFRNKKIVAKSFGGGVYLLYGPSVNQVMLGVIDEKLPEIQTALTGRFLYQFQRLSAKL